MLMKQKKKLRLLSADGETLHSAKPMAYTFLIYTTIVKVIMKAWPKTMFGNQITENVPTF